MWNKRSQGGCLNTRTGLRDAVVSIFMALFRWDWRLSTEPPAQAALLAEDLDQPDEQLPRVLVVLGPTVSVTFVRR
jgi:hypothetical protein